MKTYFIIGGAGFIGSSLSTRLVKKSCCKGIKNFVNWYKESIDEKCQIFYN